jgi:ribosome maturation factor RimP
MGDTTRDLLENLVSPIVQRAGLDLEELDVAAAGRRHRVRIVVDADGGVDLDRCAEVSTQISRVLDESDAMGPVAYTLEVSSPGVSRPLTLPRHWRRAAGRLVRVVTTHGDTVTGRVGTVTERGAVLDVDGREREIEFADVAKARVQVEFRRIDGSGEAEG